MILIRIFGSVVIVAYEFCLYFMSLVGPVVWLCDHRGASVPALLAMALVGYLSAATSFLVLLILTKRLLFSRIPTGEVSAHSKEAALWFYAVSLISILDRSPFRALLEIGLFAPLFYIGMGARIPLSSAFGLRSMLFEPWFVEMGQNVVLGAEAMIAGHVAMGDKLVLGKIVIGDNVVIGGRSLIFPDVRIGNNACVGAGAVVTRGTVIPDGETWVGIPAKPLKRAATSG